MKLCNTDFFGFGDNCTWIVLLVGAYFFLSNGCVGNIFDQFDTNTLLIIALFVFVYLYAKDGGCGC